MSINQLATTETNQKTQRAEISLSAHLLFYTDPVNLSINWH